MLGLGLGLGLHHHHERFWVIRGAPEASEVGKGAGESWC